MEDLPAKGSDDRKTSVTIGPLCLLGTSSPNTIPKDSCPAAAIPFNRFAPINVLMLFAVAPTMHPRSPRTDVPITIHFRPKISDRRPTSKNPMAEPIVQIVTTQFKLVDGPMSALIKVLRHVRKSIFRGLYVVGVGHAV